jgi:hypothetical protein
MTEFPSKIRLSATRISNRLFGSFLSYDILVCKGLNMLTKVKYKNSTLNMQPGIKF